MKKIILVIVMALNIIPYCLDLRGISGVIFAQESTGDENVTACGRTDVSEFRDYKTDGSIEITTTTCYNTVDCETDEIIYEDYDCDEVTEIIPGPEDDDGVDCNGVLGGDAYEADCGCIGGNTGITTCPQDEPDCAGVPGGSARLESCGCVGGTTGLPSCPKKDCAGVEGGSAYMAVCGCIGGTTGKISCGAKDCNGEEGGTAYIAKCGCIGGKTGITKCPPCPPSKAALKAAFVNAYNANLDRIVNLMNKYSGDFGIDTEAELEHFLAQAGHETGGFTQSGGTVESMYYKDAAKVASLWPSKFGDGKANPEDYLRDTEKIANFVYNKADLGNTVYGDGYKYLGRGIFQLTGKFNYKAFQDFYNNKYGKNIDLMNKPGLVASDPTLAVVSALWFYKTRILDKMTVTSNTPVAKVTKPINSKLEGLDKRKANYITVKEKVDCND